jgi:hypothetical protein
MNMDTGWKKIQFEDIPSREELREATLSLLNGGITNSDLMRKEISRTRKLIVTETKGKKKMVIRWNETPSEKFVNEHAWVLGDLVVKRVIQETEDKEYRLVQQSD